MKLKIKASGIASEPDTSPCLSIGAKLFCLDPKSDFTKSMIKRMSDRAKKAIWGASSPEPEFKYYGICFGLTFREYRISRHFIAPYRVELHVSLDGDYKATDGAPLNERDFVIARVRYQYGSKVESVSKLQFKLGWESKEVGVGGGGELGEKLSDDYTVILDTEVSLEYCTALYINPFTSTPGWIFERKPNQMILKDTRYVWLIVEKPKEVEIPLRGQAKLGAVFRKVKETEKSFLSLTGVQQRLLQKVAFSRARTWIEKKNLKRPVSISFDFPEA